MSKSKNGNWASPADTARLNDPTLACDLHHNPFTSLNLSASLMLARDPRTGVVSPSGAQTSFSPYVVDERHSKKADRSALTSSGAGALELLNNATTIDVTPLLSRESQSLTSSSSGMVRAEDAHAKIESSEPRARPISGILDDLLSANLAEWDLAVKGSDVASPRSERGSPSPSRPAVVAAAASSAAPSSASSTTTQAVPTPLLFDPIAARARDDEVAAKIAAAASPFKVVEPEMVPAVPDRSKKGKKHSKHRRAATTAAKPTSAALRAPSSPSSASSSTPASSRPDLLDIDPIAVSPSSMRRVSTGDVSSSFLFDLTSSPPASFDSPMQSAVSLRSSSVSSSLHNSNATMVPGALQPGFASFFQQQAPTAPAAPVSSRTGAQAKHAPALATAMRLKAKSTSGQRSAPVGRRAVSRNEQPTQSSGLSTLPRSFVSPRGHRRAASASSEAPAAAATLVAVASSSSARLSDAGGSFFEMPARSKSAAQERLREMQETLPDNRRLLEDSAGMSQALSGHRPLEPFRAPRFENEAAAALCVQRLVRGFLARRRFALHRHRYRIVCEILSSEEIYVSSLRAADRVFREPLLKSALSGGSKALLSVDDVHQIFGPMPSIAKFHDELLAMLRARVAAFNVYESTIGDVFVDAARDGSMQQEYTAYITNYDTALATVERLRSSSKAFQRWLEGAERQFWTNDRSGNSLQSFLILPVQRLARYVLLLRALSVVNEQLAARTQRTPDRHVDDALHLMTEIVASANEAERGAAAARSQRDELVSIGKRLQPRLHDLLDIPTRRVANSGACQLLNVIEDKLKPRYYFVIPPDMMLIVKVLSKNVTRSKLRLRYRVSLDGIVGVRKIDDVGRAAFGELADDMRHAVEVKATSMGLYLAFGDEGQVSAFMSAMRAHCKNLVK